jgi:hypothetical protein
MRHPPSRDTGVADNLFQLTEDGARSGTSFTSYLLREKLWYSID